MESEVFRKLAQEFALSALTIALGVLLFHGVRRSTRALVQGGQMSHVMALRLRLTARWVLAIGTTLIVMQQTGVFGQAWAVLSAIVAALAVGFVASWSLLSNATCALLMLVYRPFRAGDEIELLEADGKVGAAGRVMDVNLFFTTIIEQNDAAVRVPNNLFMQKYCRVRRAGHAPDPSRDATEGFYSTLTPGKVAAWKPPMPSTSSNVSAAKRHGA